VSLHRCKDAPYSGATQGMMPSFQFFTIFKKLPTTMSRPITRANGFLDGNSILREVRTTTYVGRDVANRSKLLAPTSPRLRCKDLRAKLESSGLRPTSFRKRSGDRLDSSSKATSKTKACKVASRPSRALGGCERAVILNS
jgi:hypothetical protein